MCNSSATDYNILDCSLEIGHFPRESYGYFFENLNKILKINLGTSNKKETLRIYVRNVLLSSKNKFVNIWSLVDNNHRIMRHQKMHKFHYNSQEY